MEFLSLHFNTSEELIILSTGNCAGKVVCKNLVVEAGGILNANVACISDQSIKKKWLISHKEQGERNEC